MPAELFYMDTEIWAKTPYDADFVESIKAEIPKEYRHWDSEEKVWVVSYLYEDALIHLCEIYYDGIVQYGRRKYTLAAQSPQAYATLHLLPSAPREVVMAAYRALSKLCHPDVSQKPDATEKMKEINIAFDRIMGKR